MCHRINIKRDNIGGFDIFRVILGMIGPDPAPAPTIPRDALAQIQKDGPCRIAPPDFLIFKPQFSGRDRRPVPPSALAPLRIVRFVGQHPPCDNITLRMVQCQLVLGRDHVHIGAFELFKLLAGGAFPQPDIKIDSGFFVFRRISRCLEPNPDWKKIRIIQWRVDQRVASTARLICSRLGTGATEQCNEDYKYPTDRRSVDAEDQ